MRVHSRRTHSGLLLGLVHRSGQSWVEFSLVLSASLKISSRLSTLATLSSPNFWRLPVRESLPFFMGFPRSFSTVPPALPDLGSAAEVVRIIDITGTLITSLFRI